MQKSKEATRVCAIWGILESKMGDLVDLWSALDRSLSLSLFQKKCTLRNSDEPHLMSRRRELTDMQYWTRTVRVQTDRVGQTVRDKGYG